MRPQKAARLPWSATMKTLPPSPRRHWRKSASAFRRPFPWPASATRRVWAEALTPPLTTVRQPAADIAKAAIAALYEMHEAETPEAVTERDISLPGRLITRASCASPARA